MTNRNVPNSSYERLESDLEREVVAYVHGELAGKCMKLALINRRGWPDRTIFLPGGRVVLVELKSSRGNVRPQQKLWMAELTDLGFICGICRTLDEVKALCQLALEQEASN